MDCVVHGILQARILQWVAYPSSSGSYRSRNRTRVSSTAGRFLTNRAIREPQECDGWIIKKADHQKLMLLNCGAGEDSRESLGLQGEQSSQS